jgi:Na+/H+ antiporter NhaD/arsenite permease-like protein
MVVGDTGIGALRFAAEGLTQLVPDMNIVVVLLGMLSAVVDNVPLVAASMAMFTYEVDHPLWHFIAFSAGTGGSMLIIGSASGVAAMGMERIDFIWYLKRITLLAFSGFIAGCILFISVEYLMA